MHPDAPFPPPFAGLPHHIPPQPPPQSPHLVAVPQDEAGHTHAWTPGLPGGIRCLGCGWSLRAVLARAQAREEAAPCSPSC